METDATRARDRLIEDLVVTGSRFARTAAQAARSPLPLLLVRLLSNLDHAGPQRVGDLAAREAVTQPAITAAVNRLEQDRLVERAPDPADRRAVIVAITAAGSERLAAFRGAASTAVAPAFTTLSDAELATLAEAAALLSRVVDSLETT